MFVKKLIKYHDQKYLLLLSALSTIEREEAVIRN